MEGASSWRQTTSTCYGRACGSCPGLMDAEVSTQIGAELHERTEDRTGYRSRSWDTRVGTVELRVPKVAPGTYFPSLLEPRRRAERALAAVIQEAYVKGISTR